MAGYDLKTALKRVSTKPSHFVLIKGEKSEQVYISPQPANAKQLTPMMEECGKGKRVAAGVCALEKGQLVFATQTAPAPAWAASVAKVLKSHQCGQYLPAGWRQLGDKESAEAATEGDGSKAKSGIGSPTGIAVPALKPKASEAAAVPKKGDVVEAKRIPDEAAARLKKAAVSAPPPKAVTSTKRAAPRAPAPALKKAEPPKPTTAPTLTTYVKAKRDWVAAKAASAKHTAALQAAILKECDPELESAVKAKLDGWEGLVTVMDDSIILKIDKAIKEPDEERQAGHNLILVEAFTKTLAALRKHPFAPVADSNPFGKFFIRAPLESLLTKLATTFSAS